MLRLQPVDHPDFSPHFGLFALVTAGRDRGGLAFELAALDEQLRVHLDFLARCAGAGYDLADVRVEIADTTDPARLATIEDRLFAPLRRDFPAVSFALDPARTHAVAYYRGLCLHVSASSAGGPRQVIGDGGFTDWSQRLAQNAKERLLVSGFGLEILERAFRPRPADDQNT
jgi:hypothetical protein